MTAAAPLFRPDLLTRYDAHGPRYTSYPTAVQFTDTFDPAHYREAASKAKANADLSLYFHIPFCDTVCFYCGCNKVATKNRAHARPYLDRMKRELALQAALFETSRPVTQLRWGGGTPTFLSHDEMAELMSATREHFNLVADERAEYSIEVDPREASEATIALLRELGFNRLSLGVQDFDERVQRAVNRIQPREMTETVLDAARKNGFESVSVDLIYGLPHQSVESFSRTLDAIIDLKPDRVSVFGYAHMPSLFKMQRQIDESALPSPAVRLAILERVIARMGEAGYVYIGMDHFALPGDELARAFEAGTLQRNFQGYSTHGDCDIVGLGVSAIGRIGDSYSQNARDLIGYYAALDAGRLPLMRGLQLDEDDLIRRELINELMCHGTLDKRAFGARHRLLFDEYFVRERQRLVPLIEDGLVVESPREIRVTSRGRLLLRIIAMCFDAYLDDAAQAPRYSRVI